MNPFLIALSMWNQRALWHRDVTDDMQVALSCREQAWDFISAGAAIPGGWLRLGAVGELLDREDLPHEIVRRAACQIRGATETSP